jgi:hypothetical protein
MRLWIDDERVMPAEFTHMAMSSVQAIRLLEQAEDVELVSFDHDLGGLSGDDTSRPVLTWMIEHYRWPREIRFHTANPVGRDWLEGTARRYAPAHVLVSASNPYAGWM